MGFIIYENKKLVKFTYFHLVYNSEGFFFNISLQKILFHIENYLFSKSNAQFSYGGECQIRGLFYNIHSLHVYLTEYVNWNLFENEKQTQLFQNILEKYPYLNPNWK